MNLPATPDSGLHDTQQAVLSTLRDLFQQARDDPGEPHDGHAASPFKAGSLARHLANIALYDIDTPFEANTDRLPAPEDPRRTFDAVAAAFCHGSFLLDGAYPHPLDRIPPPKSPAPVPYVSPYLKLVNSLLSLSAYAARIHQNPQQPEITPYVHAFRAAWKETLAFEAEGTP